MPDLEQKDSVVFLLTELLRETRRSNDAKAAESVREVMDVEQAAEYLGQWEYTLWEWARRRKIPHCKINGSIKFRKSKLDRWMDRNEIPGF